MPKPNSVLVVAAHPDDEVLGCGGAMARHAAAGDRVFVMFLADGVTSRESKNPNRAINDRQKAARTAARILGAEPPTFCNFPDNRLDTIPLLDMIKAVERVTARVRPGIVYTHHAKDLNVDHRRTHEAVMTACRPVPGSMTASIYGFETASSTEWALGTGGSFRPTRFVDITGFLDRKLQALEQYAHEMRPFPHARSREAIRAMARARGVIVGLRAAEAFEVFRQVRRAPIETERSASLVSADVSLKVKNRRVTRSRTSAISKHRK